MGLMKLEWKEVAVERALLVETKRRGAQQAFSRL
jgi:hypothetical protein